MSSSSFGFSFGARYMLDQTAKFTGQLRAPVFLRMQEVDEEFSDFAEIGLAVTVSGSLSGSAGFSDYNILPQPLVEETPSQRGKGVKETQSQVGSTKFTISHTWVLQQMQTFGFTNPMSVWRDPRVIGLVYNDEIMSIESIYAEHVAGNIIYWEITAKAPEINVTG